MNKERGQEVTRPGGAGHRGMVKVQGEGLLSYVWMVKC